MRPMKDPAPSRFAYKLNRLLMRRGVRLFLRYGLPVLILASIGVFWASDEARVQDAHDRVAELRRQLEERPEFMVRMMAVENASPRVAADIREILSLDFPLSSFDLDLNELRGTVEELNAVADAAVRIRTGGVLEIAVVERRPVAVWRADDGLHLVDIEGHLVAALDLRAERPELPLVAGQGAEAGIAEALALFQVGSPVQDRLRGFLRVGQRRWDVVLDRNVIIMLPEENAVQAFEKVIALDRAQDLLARDIAAVDFRNPRRPVLRLGPMATENLYETDFNPEEAAE